MKRVTILDIANELNITFSTVARALNDHPAISEATKKAVRETAERLNYRQNKIASSLRSGRTNIIGVIVPSLHVSFFSSVVHGIERVMNENGYTTLLYQSNESKKHEDKGIETFLQSRVDGIIASITTETDDVTAYKEITKRNVPLIFFDRKPEELSVSSVTIDDYKGGFIATQHLIQQGYKKILHITAEQNISIFKERLRGYIDALRHYNIPVDEDLIIKGKFSLDFGKTVVKDFRERGIGYDGVFALEDYTAMGVMQQLMEYKIRVPEEVGVIGFANEAFGSLVTPQLSTIDQQTITMGEEAAKLFLELQKQGKTNTETAKKIVLEPILQIRASSHRSLLR
ncbi:LacI family DNA-binding transcriptional regulator [Pedobacter sp. SYSU D00535]|uniref:LacI family DNA-binding transcriptional regulator n=1 Tax=Pedobacter sp. SYSU D00535 TaxID=2810308 RepID=UPI001A95D91D|nr:LacI family DNA-binding transcriptional regulator [Pedobacter sp. SYSU D00535]